MKKCEREVITMAKVYAMIANGTEEVECLAVVDILRRSGAEVVLTAVSDTRQIVSSHQITIVADQTIGESDLSDADAIFLPGGMPGAENLSACAPLIEALRQAYDSGKRIAAICAAPAVVLGRHGFLQGRMATCFPGFEHELTGAVHTDQGVVTDGNITTARGLGFAIDLGLELAKLLVSQEVSDTIKSKIQYNW